MYLEGRGCALKANLGESEKRNEGWVRGDGIEGWAEDGKEGRGASCSSVTCILVPGEAERRSAQTFAGAFSRRKKDGGGEGEGRRGKKIQRTWFLMVWVCRRAKRSKF